MTTTEHRGQQRMLRKLQAERACMDQACRRDEKEEDWASQKRKGGGWFFPLTGQIHMGLSALVRAFGLCLELGRGFLQLYIFTISSRHWRCQPVGGSQSMLFLAADSRRSNINCSLQKMCRSHAEVPTYRQLPNRASSGGKQRYCCSLHSAPFERSLPAILINDVAGCLIRHLQFSAHSSVLVHCFRKRHNLRFAVGYQFSVRT